jgi:hypothetical protein
MRDAFPIMGKGREGRRRREGKDGFIPLHQKILDAPLAMLNEFSTNPNPKRSKQLTNRTHLK